MMHDPAVRELEALDRRARVLNFERSAYAEQLASEAHELEDESARFHQESDALTRRTEPLAQHIHDFDWLLQHVSAIVGLGEEQRQHTVWFDDLFARLRDHRQRTREFWLSYQRRRAVWEFDRDALKVAAASREYPRRA